VWRRAREQVRPTGIITCFPHLPAILGLHERLTGVHVPIVAWAFNLGALRGGVSRILSRYALASVDRFIVHARAEIEPYQAWLDVPGHRLQFVPLQRPVRPVEFSEDADDPFVLAMGSAHRDYATFAQAVAITGYRAVVVAAPHALRGVDFPPQVQVCSGLSVHECNALVQKARVVVVPVDNDTTASGQVALLSAMMYGRPVIATRCAGTADYVRDGVNGLLVDRADATDMAACLKLLWESPERRVALGAHARDGIRRQHSDRAIAGALAMVLSSVRSGNAQPPGSVLDVPWRDTEPALHALQ
jgi:glycosyltransferase involved in cell wall biosynthesis